MYEYYGLYQRVRNASWKCLIDFNVVSLPVSSIDIAKQAGIKVVKNSIAHKLSEVEFSISVYQPAKTRWAIIYDDTLDANEYRWSVAHELGHILLGHEYKCTNGTFSFETAPNKLEIDADKFALRLLAPACVIWGLGLQSSDDIAHICGIPARYASKRAARMRELYQRDKFLSSSMEKKVYENFSSWIEIIKKP